MLLDVTAYLADDRGGEKLDRLMAALLSSLRETDLIGWYAERSTLGIIFTEIRGEARKSTPGTLLSRVTGCLYRALQFDHFNLISITHHIYPEEWDHDVQQRPSHPALYPDLSDQESDHSLYSIAKRLLDIIASAVGLLICLPLVLLTALAIKLTSNGPVLFRQVRVGQYGKPFVFLKFRSMYVNNDPAIHKAYITSLINAPLEASSSTEKTKVIFKITRDPRVTRVGRFLRQSSLDELPQLCNVLKGEMSLVGPRPPIPYEVEAYQSWHRRRLLEAKPGITGLWQVKGRSRVSFDEMVRLDLRYATNRSFWLDLRILVQTPGAVIRGGGAY